MKSSLQLNFSQQLSMTPQLQQAIRLLQLSTLELQQEINQALEENPLLEIDEQLETPAAKDNEEKEANLESKSNQESLENETNADASTLEDSASHLENAKLSDDLDIDAQWDDVYSAGTGNTGLNLDDELPIYQGETTQSLQDYLLWQLDLTPFSDTDRSIAMSILDGIDDKGYLTISLEDVLESMGDPSIELDEVQAVLKRIQQFDPLGVASRNLQECLLIQLASFPEDTPWLAQAKAILNQHIELIAKRDYKLLCRAAKLTKDELVHVLNLLQQLDPHPGNAISNNSQTQYIVPDVYVVKMRGKWQVVLNNDNIPRLKVNQTYAAMKPSSQADNQYIRTHVQDAKWLIKSLESRNETLLKVARCIVEHQQDFFEYGEQAMKPMILNDIANDVELHESTVSRVTTQKYMHTSRGIFELKYFFSSHVATNSGGECSSTAIRAHIQELIAAENPEKPLSDSKLESLLADKGIKVARRTVAKYRESLGIASSSQRKRLL
ncbi:MAG: RNA polymerase factor sigma-54 [Vibrio sp.]